ncbi:hypothetical protein ACVIOG_005423 [Rhizobium leguminosarum]
MSGGQQRPAVNPPCVAKIGCISVANSEAAAFRLALFHQSRSALFASGCRHRASDPRRRGEGTCRSVSTPSSPLGEKVPVGRMRGPSEAGLSYNPCNRAGVVSTIVKALGTVSRNRVYVRVPCGPLIRLPAPSPRGKKRFAAASPFLTRHICQKRTVKSVPLPTSDLTISRARWRVRMCLTMARPRPVPFFERLSSMLTR